MPKLRELDRFGPSIWLDFIRRSFITSGNLKALIDRGVKGVTSNLELLSVTSWLF
jgi:transaldolase